MENFPGNDGFVDNLAFRAATEAVIGLTLKGERVDVETVTAWFDAAATLDIPTRETHGRAVYFAKRMTEGPFRPDGSKV